MYPESQNWLMNQRPTTPSATPPVETINKANVRNLRLAQALRRRGRLPCRETRRVGRGVDSGPRSTESDASLVLRRWRMTLRSSAMRAVVPFAINGLPSRGDGLQEATHPVDRAGSFSSGGSVLAAFPHTLTSGV
jgi:hypothetical protein